MKTVIEMAREAGIVFDERAHPFYERFAELVRADEREAIIATASDMYYWDHTEKLIEAIRARGNT